MNDAVWAGCAPWESLADSIDERLKMRKII
jgi:hypothetical protein